MTMTVPMTVEGAEALRVELQELKQIRRPAVIQAIAEARAHGDLKENAEYHAAKDEQGFIEGRIKEIEGKLSVSQVIDVKKLPQEGRVVFGVTVVLYNESTEQEVCYKIVGEDESDLKQNKISITSPIARALIGKLEGDVGTVDAPAGQVDYEIVKVQYI